MLFLKVRQSGLTENGYSSKHITVTQKTVLDLIIATMIINNGVSNRIYF